MSRVGNYLIGEAMKSDWAVVDMVAKLAFRVGFRRGLIVAIFALIIGGIIGYYVR